MTWAMVKREIGRFRLAAKSGQNPNSCNLDDKSNPAATLCGENLIRIIFE